MTAVIQGAALNHRRKKTGREGRREDVKNVSKKSSMSTVCDGEEISSEKWCSMSEEGRGEDKESK